jgi:hypothetical protein
MPPLRQRVLRLVAIVVGIQAMFVFFFVFPGHDPEPNGLPVGVAGPPAAAEAFGRQLERGQGEFDVKRYATPEAARQAILDREAYGAFVLGPAGPRELITAQAASFTVTQLLREVATAAGVRQVQELRPLDREDPRGVSLNLFVLPVIITSILAALIATQLAPDLDLRGRVLVISGVAALAGLINLVIVNTGIGAIPGPLLAEAGLVALAVIGIAFTSGAIIRLVGPAGTFLAFALFLMIGNPASGLTSAPELLPSPWKEVGPFLPPGAVGEALRNTAYFDGVALAFPVLVLLAWVVIGVALNLVSERRQPEPVPDRH